MEEFDTTIEIPVSCTKAEQDGKVYYVISPNEGTKEIFKHGIVVEGDTLEEAKKEFLISLKVMIDYELKRSDELDKWKLFQKGDWKRTGGTWFNIFGLHFYFRYGKNMKHGWYIPYTKLNIMFTNHWKKNNHNKKIN